MSSISLVVARNSPLGRAQVLQESVNNSVNISNNDINKNGKREVIIVRKKSKAAPSTVSVTSLIQNTENVTSSVPTKRSRLRDDTEEQTKAPTPLAVARRNARERNRVRQVNDGFAALRRHIPDEVAEAFENANSNRGPNKKLSKVETLRMAVEYIRNLESLLDIEHAVDKENSCHPSIDSFPSPASSSPRETSQERSYFMMNSPGLDEEEFEDEDIENSFTQLPQYIGLPSQETFQLVSTPHLYEDDEGGPPLTPSSDLLSHEDINSHLLEGAFQFPNAAEHFSVITDRSYCVDAEGNMNDDFEVKYVDTLQSQANLIATSAIIPLDGLPNNIVIDGEHYNPKMQANSYANEYNEIELKKELPDIKVTPEDREQFEETLKWWQEKTKLSLNK